jgi:ribonucleotide monophosphatase NagD (HAD superfamily)
MHCRVMPGTLARHYAACGGQVLLMGKPAPIIYSAALDMLQLPPEQVIAVGDSLEHDIGGAQAAGIHSVFVLGGIHATDVQLAPLQQAQQDGGSSSSGGYSYSEEQLAAVCLSHGVAPTFLSAYFK